MRRGLHIFILGAIFLIMPQVAAAGSQTYSSPGTYTFTVPAHSGLTVTVNGAGGGGGAGMGTGMVQGDDGTAGGTSRFGSVYGYGGGGGTRVIKGGEGCYPYPWYGSGAAGSAGSASGGDTNTTGGGASGGAGGNSAGSVSFCGPGGAGGAGGRAVKTYSAANLLTGTQVTVSVGGGGAGGGGISGNGGSSGQSGSVSITWTDAPPPSCTINLSPTTINQGQTSTLTWSSSNADWFYINNVGYVVSSGGAYVSPSQTTTYTGTVGGPGGQASCTGNTSPVGRLTVNQSCSLPWGGSITHGQSTTAYQTATVPYGSSCVSQTRTCTNGSLSGSYQYGSCNVNPPASCTLGGVTVEHGESHTFYSVQSAPSGTVCSSYAQSRTCTNGSLSGSATYSYGSCSCTPFYYCVGQEIRHADSSCFVTSIAICSSPYFCSQGSSVCLFEDAEGGFENGSALRIIPSFVRAGATATVSWDVENAQSCTITGSNDDSWSGTSGSEETSAIQEVTTYTLTCDDLDPDSTEDDLTETDTVYIIPTWLEL